MEMFYFEVPMTEKESDIQNTPNPQQNNVGVNSDRKQSKLLLILFLVFVVFVVMVFVSQDKEPINWNEDYQAGVELAKQENKPILLAFHKRGSEYSINTFNDTYKNSKVQKFVKENFIPILIDNDKQPMIRNKYNVNYNVVHIVVNPNKDKQYQSRLGYDPPGLFIVEIKKLMKQADLPVE
jgi:hypothetical protein